MKRIIAGLLLAGCSAENITELTGIAPAEDFVPAERARKVAFAPDMSPAAEDGLTLAIGRWEAAGVMPGQFVRSPAGARVTVTAAPIMLSDGPHNGAFSRKDGLRVWADAPQWARTWTHELGHAAGLVHAEEGIMGREDAITVASLEAMCARLLCRGAEAWEPEQ